MVLVDTSVWIRFLGNRAPYAAALDTLLSRDEVVGHELVYGELLIGNRGERKKLLGMYEQMHQAIAVPHRDVGGTVPIESVARGGAGIRDCPYSFEFRFGLASHLSPAA